MSVYNKIINWKIIKNRNLSRVVDVVCYEPKEKVSSSLLINHFNQDRWVKIGLNDHRRIKKEENDDLNIEVKGGRRIYQAFIDPSKPSLRGVDFDFSPWKGKEIIFWINFSHKYGLNLSGVSSKLVLDSVEVEGSTLRQKEADIKGTTREEIQWKWEKEEVKELRILDVIENYLEKSELYTKSSKEVEEMLLFLNDLEMDGKNDQSKREELIDYLRLQLFKFKSSEAFERRPLTEEKKNSKSDSEKQIAQIEVPFERNPNK